MQILNLVFPERSEIAFKPSNFPDGQQQIKIITPGSAIEETVAIYSRLNNFLDLEKIACATASLRNLKVKEISLYAPYFLGARSDIKFEEGSNNYLKDVIFPIVNGLNFESVIVMDPHSTNMEMGLKNFKSYDNSQLVMWALGRIIATTNADERNQVLVSPDGGALKKIFKLVDQIRFKGEVINCAKSRDLEGKLTHVSVPSREDHFAKDLIIIDDICDGGGTFINIAKEIKKQQPERTGKLYLIVTHGIFSKGLEELSEYFDGIFCTNSYQGKETSTNFENALVHLLDVF